MHPPDPTSSASRMRHRSNGRRAIVEEWPRSPLPFLHLGSRILQRLLQRWVLFLRLPDILCEKFVSRSSVGCLGRPFPTVAPTRSLLAYLVGLPNCQGTYTFLRGSGGRIPFLVGRRL